MPIIQKVTFSTLLIPFSFVATCRLQQLSDSLMKNKENPSHPHPRPRRKKSEQRNSSLSMDRPQKRSNFSSMIFESGRNSLCSPREQAHPDKYQNYMQFITTNKFVETNPTLKASGVPPRRNSVTPTPRRISTSLIQQGRRSVTGKENAGRDRNGSFSKQERERDKLPRARSKPLFVKGSNIVKVDKGQTRGESKKKENTIRPASSGMKKGKQGKEKTGKDKGGKQGQTIQSKQDAEQQKLLQQLFKDIQFYRDLGRGAHALVKSGVDWKTKRKIAIKIYQKGELKQEEMRSIKREVEILGSLDHPHIIKLYEIFESHRTINLIMEYGGGNSVDQYLRNKKKGYLQEPQAKQIFSEVLQGVAYMHERGVAHRDIKPQNVLLNKYLKVKIIDFGFGLKVDPSQPINQYCGTPTYMPPEVVSKIPHSPFLADRWSLGILLYTMLNGHCPFKAQNQKELFLKICAGQYECESFVSPEAKELIGLFLRAEPQKRLGPAQALLNPWLRK